MSNRWPGVSRASASLFVYMMAETDTRWRCAMLVSVSPGCTITSRGAAPRDEGDTAASVGVVRKTGIGSGSPDDTGAGDGEPTVPRTGAVGIGVPSCRSVSRQEGPSCGPELPHPDNVAANIAMPSVASLLQVVPFRRIAVPFIGQNFARHSQTQRSHCPVKAA